MRIQTLIKLVAAIIVLTVLLCTMIIVTRFLEDPNEVADKPNNEIEKLAPQREPIKEQVKIEQIKKRLKKSNPPEIVLGLPAFQKARRMLEAGNFADARKFLEEIVVLHEGTPSELEAYRVLGEMNIDDLMSIKDGDGKFIYTVKSGDSYLGIVNKFKTNFDLMMMLNNLMRMDKLRPKDKLVIMPLNLSLKIIPHKNQVLLLGEKGNVVKLYEPIYEITLPKKGESVITTVERVEAYKDGKRVNATRGNYREADKIIKIQNPNLEIRSETDSLSKSFRGILLSPSDIEELALILRSGNSVEIQY